MTTYLLTRTLSILETNQLAFACRTALYYLPQQIHDASSVMPEIFPHGLSSLFAKLAKARGHWLSSALLYRNCLWGGAVLLRLKHLHRVSVTKPLLTLPISHGLLRPFRHLTARTSLPGLTIKVEEIFAELFETSDWLPLR